MVHKSIFLRESARNRLDCQSEMTEWILDGVFRNFRRKFITIGKFPMQRGIPLYFLNRPYSGLFFMYLCNTSVDTKICILKKRYMLF